MSSRGTYTNASWRTHDRSCRSHMRISHIMSHVLTRHGIHTAKQKVCSSVLQCVEVCCSVLQCVAVCCSMCCGVLQCVFTMCVAVCCNVSQCIAVCTMTVAPFVAGTHTNEPWHTYQKMVRYTATHCNKLQHTATQVAHIPEDNSLLADTTTLAESAERIDGELSIPIPVMSHILIVSHTSMSHSI